ncbi:MAG: phosphatase PAP2 family protein [Solirubrobacteraceae bacterium]
MTIRPGSLRARVLPHGWLDLLRQLLLFGGAYMLYRLVRGLADSRTTVAFQHARELINVERALHFFVEPSVQAWAAGSHLLMEASTWLYITAQSSVLVGVLLYLYMFHNRSFYFVRNMLMVAMGVALVGYVAFPTAPPRFLPEWGFFDSVADFTGVPATTASVNALFNPYAAIPSMHVAFALMLGWPLARLVRHRAVRVFWLCYPFVITFVTVATANHFLADALLGAVAAGFSAFVAARLGRLRPQAWNFGRPEAVGAT